MSDRRSGISESPLGQLRKARAARGATARAKYARAGLAQSPEDAETRWLLMRQLYISHLEQGALDRALTVAAEMIDVFEEVTDVARFDLARVFLAQHDWQAAREQLLLGEQVAPPSRQWDLVFAVARLEAALGDSEGALAILGRSGKSVVRLSQDAVVHGAVLAWKAAAGRRPRRSSLARAYERVSATNPLPVFGQFVGALLLDALGRPEARAVTETFLRDAGRLPAVARFGLAAEVHWAREGLLGKSSVST